MPNNLHWQCVKRLLRYLIFTSGHKLCLDRLVSLEPVGHVDSDYASDVATRNSTSGYVFMMAGAAVSWCSRLQEVATLSSNEAEYVSLSNGVKEAVFLLRVVANLKI